jgi:rhombotail lipoprotein
MKPLPLAVAFCGALVGALFLSSGCVSTGPRKTQKSSSVVAFLYPKQAEPMVAPSLPVLKLPLKVGLAFVPMAGEFRADFTEAQKQGLLNRVAAEFRANAFIESIDVIPTTYLRAGGGFDNLDQMRSMLGLDVVVLLAYDQMQFTDENKLYLE